MKTAPAVVQLNKQHGSGTHKNLLCCQESFKNKEIK
jgi:hypothetical protein